MADYDYLIFIGRFQPLHCGHLWVIKEAFLHADSVIVLIGSAERPRTPKNPFSFFERKNMIEQALTDTLKPHQTLICLPLPDFLYNDYKWIQHVQRLIEPFLAKGRVGIIGHKKDDSSYYLSLFATLTPHQLPSYKNLSATPIRAAYFEGNLWQKRAELPEVAFDFLESFARSNEKEYQALKKAYEHIKACKAQFEGLPCSPIFQMVNALVVCDGHILVVQRGEYGSGLFAMAGGLVGIHETLEQACLRELKEETGLDLSRFHAFNQKTFDTIGRSLWERAITTVFCYDITGTAAAKNGLPELTVGDDVSEVCWLPFHRLSSAHFFEDHYDIVSLMLGLD